MFTKGQYDDALRSLGAAISKFFDCQYYYNFSYIDNLFYSLKKEFINDQNNISYGPENVSLHRTFSTNQLQL